MIVICIMFIVVLFHDGLLFAKSQNGLQNNSKKSEKNQELARVAIFPIEDRTKSRNFKYLSGSLSDAINTSMLKNFTYLRISPSDVIKSMREMRQEILKGKKKRREVQKKLNPTNTEKTEEQLQEEKKRLVLVRKVAKNLSADIIIFGDYSYDKETTELVFTVFIYYTVSDQFKKLDEARNFVDNTLFQKTSEVARKLVTEIHNMAEEAQKIASEKKGGKRVDERQNEITQVKEGEKVALTKSMIANTLDWTSKKVSITLAPGFFLKTRSAGAKTTSAFCRVCEMEMALSGRFWILPRVYIGAKLDYGEIWTQTIPHGSIHVFDGFALVGYSIPVHRWLFSADLGMGYYRIVDETFGDIYNPAFSYRIGAEVLLARSLSLGISANMQMYYDKPTSLFFGGLALTFGYVL